jgi:HAD superfamily hydrolase (TIGR01490 family)
LKKIAFFDFDGTITKKDSLLEFIKFSKGNLRFYFGFLLNSPFLVAYKLKIISNQKAKERILQFFFGNMLLDKFEKICEDFNQQVIPGLIRPGALKEIGDLKKDNVEVVVVSASPENWIRQWTESMQVKLIATRLEVKDKKITGKIAGYNCHGKEKLNRILKEYNLEEFAAVYAYGDSSGDKLMLSLAHHQFMKPFR